VILDSLVDFLFLADVFVNLNTPFIDGQRKLVVQRCKIFTNYLCGWMVIDVVSSIPMDFIELVVLGSDQTFNNDLLKLARLPRI